MKIIKASIILPTKEPLLLPRDLSCRVLMQVCMCAHVHAYMGACVSFLPTAVPGLFLFLFCWVFFFPTQPPVSSLPTVALNSLQRNRFERVCCLLSRDALN